MSEKHLISESRQHIDESLRLIYDRINRLESIKDNLKLMCRSFSKHYFFNIILVCILIAVFLIMQIVYPFILSRVINLSQFYANMDKLYFFIHYYLPIWATNEYFVFVFGKRLFKIRSIKKAYLCIDRIESVKDILYKYSNLIISKKEFIYSINGSNNEIVSYNIDQKIDTLTEEHDRIRKELSRKTLNILIIVFYWISLITYVPASSNLLFSYFYDNGKIYDYETSYTVYCVIMYFMLFLISLVLTNNGRKLSIWTFLTTTASLVALITLLALYIGICN